jgi:tight adherence protein B
MGERRRVPVNRRTLRGGILLCVLAAAVTLGVTTARAAMPTRSTPTSQEQKALKVTPIQRIPFPDRGFVIDLPQDVALGSSSVNVMENGEPVKNVAFTPLAGSGLGFGVVLAIDASDSMHGRPFRGALAAAQSFIDKHGTGEEVGLVDFNGSIHVLQAPTLSMSLLRRKLGHPPALAAGTRIYDAVGRALALIAKAKLSTAAIVLLTDGTNVGGTATLRQAIARARAQNVRIFTVGLRSRTFDPTALRALATQTGGAYAEATSPTELAPIYASLSGRLAREYVLEYQSLAPPKSHVNVQVSIRGFGSSTSDYTAPTPSGLAPYHESFLTRFVLSAWSLFLLALVVAGAIVFIVQALLKKTRSDVVERLSAYSGGGAGKATPASGPVDGSPRDRRRRTHRATASSARGALARLDRALEIADIRMSAGTVVGLTIVATLLTVVILATVSPVFAILGLLTPVVSRELVQRALNKVRADFAEQLPSNLQVLASALRSGYSFSAALATAVEQAHDPSRRELRRVVADDQLGVPMDVALRRVAERMKSRDLEQVALVAELQRTTGGNVAEVLDVVVGTIRDRQDVRRLLKTLTAQGRMARWILTGLPVVTGLVFYAYQPDVVGPFYSTLVGQVALVLAGIMVVCGSLVIQRLVDIEV